MTNEELRRLTRARDRLIDFHDTLHEKKGYAEPRKELELIIADVEMAVYGRSILPNEFLPPLR